MEKAKIIRVSTIPMSLNLLLKGQLKHLNQYFDVIAVSSDGEDLKIVRDREGIETRVVNMERKISLIKDIVALIGLYFLFKKEKPTIVHSITPKAGLLSMLAAKLARVPIRMHTFTGLIFPSKTGGLQKILIIMDKLLCWAATHIYPEGQGVKNDLITYQITTKPLKVLANGNVNGVDISYYNSDIISEVEKDNLGSNLHIEKDDFIYLFVGRLVRDKGIMELVKAFELIKDSRSKLLLVGPYESELDPLDGDTIHKISNNKNIIHVGYQQDVRSFMTIAHALVFPSYREGFPNVVLQAGAMGLPCIVTDINGSNEIITNGFNGVIIPVKDTTALAKAMEEIKLNHEFYYYIKSNSRPNIINKYEQTLVWTTLYNEYLGLISQKNLYV